MNRLNPLSSNDPPCLQHLKAACLFACMILSACATTGDRVSPPDEVVYKDPAFRKAYDGLQRGSYEKAISLLSDIILSSSGKYESAMIAEAYRLRGECRRKTNKFGLARFDYDQAVKITEAASPQGEDTANLAVKYKTAIGDTYMYEGAYLKADRIFEELLQTRMLTPYQDSLYFRRYICASKLGTPDPERFCKKIRDMSSFNETELRREFLGGGTATHLYQKPDRKRTPPTPSRDPLAVLPRSTWNAGPVGKDIDLMTPIYRMTVHHTADECNTLDFDSSAAQILAYQDLHKNTKGWADIGYHFIIDRAGRIWEGRELKYQGAHAGNSEKNKGNIGICLLGDYDRQELTEAQKEMVAGFLKKLCRIYKIDPRTNLYTHRELNATECPGKTLQQFMDSYRNIFL
ncbi:MAG: N-acetylmuramoyl-L-alanine amidase [Planctomycetota bacterium]